MVGIAFSIKVPDNDGVKSSSETVYPCDQHTHETLHS